MIPTPLSPSELAVIIERQKMVLQEMRNRASSAQDDQATLYPIATSPSITIIAKELCESALEGNSVKTRTSSSLPMPNINPNNISKQKKPPKFRHKILEFPSNCKLSKKTHKFILRRYSDDLDPIHSIERSEFFNKLSEIFSIVFNLLLND